MTVASAEAPALTDDEVVTIKRFKLILRDIGVQTRIAHFFIRNADCDSKVAAELFGAYMADVAKNGATEMYDSGLSFREIVRVAEQTMVIPADFLPKKETVDKIVRAFWDMYRAASV